MASIHSYISGFNLDKFSRFIFIFLFFAIITVPSLVDIFNVQPLVEPIVENRTLALLPNFTEIGDISKTIDQSMKWFDDHFGFRSLLIRIKNQIDLSVFGTSNRVHIGPDGWLNYRNTIDQHVQAVEAMSNADMDHVLQLIINLRDFLTARNIELVIFTIQMKDRFYPEFFPAASARRAFSRQRFDKLKENLNKLEGLTYIDSTPMLLRLKQNRPIFHKTDFHWNDPAAFEMAKVLVNHFADAKNDSHLMWRYELNIEKKQYSGGEAQFMPLLSPLQEEALFLAPFPQEQAISLVWEHKVAPFEWVTHAPVDSTRLLPPLVMFGDSFLNGVMRSGFQDHFESVSRSSVYNAKMNDILRSMPPDTRYFIFEFNELSVPYLKLLIKFDPKVVAEPKT